MLIRMNPIDGNMYNRRGVAYRKIGGLDDALRDLNKAIDLQPLESDRYRARGGVYFEQH
jgi:Flp pilus assembly protein TadD